MECSSLLFIGLCYSFVSYGFSNLMLYFVVQALSSVNIFVFYSVSIESLLLLFVFLKLAFFPFFGWFILVVSKLNNSLFLMISTVQKIPTIVLFILFFNAFSRSYFSSCLILTTFVSSLFMFNSYNLRTLLSFSSVGRNSWFLLSSLCGLEFFLLFIFLYSINFYLVLYVLGNMSKFSNLLPYKSRVYLFVTLVALAGFPPFPVFFSKLYIIYCMVYTMLFSPSLLLILLVSVVYMLSCYMRFMFSYFINLFGLPLSTSIYTILFLLRYQYCISLFEVSITFKKVTLSL